MHEAQCTVPSLHCIRAAKKFAAAAHFRTIKQENCERDERIKQAEQKHLRVEQEKKDRELVEKKAALFDKLSAEDFTIKPIYIYNDFCTYNTFISENCPPTNSDSVLTSVSLAKRTIGEPHHKYYDTSRETDLQRAGNDFDIDNVAKKIFFNLALCLFVYVVYELLMFLEWIYGRVWGERVIELGEI
jgi:hypothetical protein